MRDYIKPSLAIEMFDLEDVITDSGMGGGNGEDIEDPGLEDQYMSEDNFELAEAVSNIAQDNVRIEDPLMQDAFVE